MHAAGTIFVLRSVTLSHPRCSQGSLAFLFIAFKGKDKNLYSPEKVLFIAHSPLLILLCSAEL